MKKHKEEPGVFIPYEQVLKLLNEQYYGTQDLVMLGLFHNDGCVHKAIKNGLLSFNKVNKKTMFISRDDVLKYWKEYRSTEYEPANVKISFHLTQTEKNKLYEIVALGRNKVDHRASIDDVFRNFINYTYANREGIPTHPHSKLMFKVNQ